MNPTLRYGAARLGFHAGWVGLLLAAAWLISAVVLDAGDPVVRSGALFRVTYGASLLLAVVQVPALVALGLAAAERAPVAALAAASFGALSVPLAVGAHFLSGAVVPLLMESPSVETAPVLAAIYQDTPFSIYGPLAAVGFAMLGAAWLVLAPLLPGADLAQRALAVAMVVVGVLAVAGAVGAYLGVGWLALAWLVGRYLLVVAFALLTVYFGRRRAPGA